MYLPHAYNASCGISWFLGTASSQSGAYWFWSTKRNNANFEEKKKFTSIHFEPPRIDFWNVFFSFRKMSKFFPTPRVFDLALLNLVKGFLEGFSIVVSVWSKPPSPQERGKNLFFFRLKLKSHNFQFLT